MSRQDLKIPTTEEELFWKNHPELANDALVDPRKVTVVSGQILPEFVKNLPAKAVKSLGKATPLGRIGVSVINPPKAGEQVITSEEGDFIRDTRPHEKKAIRDYHTDPKRATFNKKTKRWYDVPIQAFSTNTGKVVIKDPILQRLNLDLWGKNEEGKQGLIVDKKGRPVAFGHGTPYKIKGTLDPSKTASRSEFKGVYTSTIESEFPKYMKGQDGKFTKDSNVHKLYLRMYNPLRLVSPEGEVGMDSFAMNEEDSQIVSEGLTRLRIELEALDPTDPNHSTDISKIKTEAVFLKTPMEVERYLHSLDSGLELTEFFQSLGYDGVLQQSVPHGESDYTEAILFNKGNVKSATDNKGTFLENDDLYSKNRKRRKKDLQIVA